MGDKRVRPTRKALSKGIFALKESPLKGYLRAHSLAYFEPKPQTEADGTPRKFVGNF